MSRKKKKFKRIQGEATKKVEFTYIEMYTEAP